MIDDPLEKVRKLRVRAAEKQSAKYLKALNLLAANVAVFIMELDIEMRKPSTPERGARIAKLSNALEMSNDRVRFSVLGEDWRKPKKERVAHPPRRNP